MNSIRELLRPSIDCSLFLRISVQSSWCKIFSKSRNYCWDKEKYHHSWDTSPSIKPNSLNHMLNWSLNQQKAIILSSLSTKKLSILLNALISSRNYNRKNQRKSVKLWEPSDLMKDQFWRKSEKILGAESWWELLAMSEPNKLYHLFTNIWIVLSQMRLKRMSVQLLVTFSLKSLMLFFLISSTKLNNKKMHTIVLWF